MNVFNEGEKNFIKRVVVSTKKDLEGLDLDPTKKEDLLKIINTSRSRGYIVARRIDGGKDMDIYRSIKEKLGAPIKPRIEIIMEQNKKQAEEFIKIIHKSFIPRIERKKQELKDVIQERDDALQKIEDNLIKELNQLKSKELDLLNRQEIIKNARQKLDQEKKIKKKHDKADDGLVKCWECGEWFKSGAGISAHKRAIHPELKE